MSEVRKALQDQAADGALVVKMLKWLGWVLIIFGALLTITLIGAFAGIPIVTGGAICLFISKLLARKHAAFQSASSEIAEIHERKLQQTRATQDSK